MYRTLLKDLETWKNSSARKPLIIYGARQVGKTWLMKEFGRTSYKKVAYVTFCNNPFLSKVFSSGYDIKKIITSLSIESSVNITKGDTLIILDEIQNSPNALESLKYFCEDANEYHVIAAGSLLGVALHSGISFPVGKVDSLHLYPMSFTEYLLALGKDILASALSDYDFSIIDNFSEDLLFHLKNYMFVGGMPEVVLNFSKDNDYSKVRDLQRKIISRLKKDFVERVSRKDFEKINLVIDSIPMQLAKENKKFFFGKIKQGSRSADFENAIQWLQDAGLVYKVHKVTSPKIPLKAYIDLSSFKLFMVDVGLLGALSGISAKAILQDNALFTEFKGALAEQFVFQELKSDTPYTPFYYGTQSATFEQDFLIEKDLDVIPIEVKASKNVNSPSLKAYISKFNSSVAVRYSSLPYIKQDVIRNIPLYAVGAIKLDEI